MNTTKKSTLLLILTAILCLAAMIGILFIVAPSRPVRADEETKETVKTVELEEKEGTGYIPNPDSEMKGGIILEEKKEEVKETIEEKGAAEKEQPASKLATVKGIPEEKLLPHYHILGKYQGYDVEVRAYDMSEHGPYYEYNDMFDYFFRRNDIVWNNGNEPRTCSEYGLAVFDCIDCGEMVVFGLSGVHTLDGESEIVEGYEVKTCSVCGQDIGIDWYTHETIPDDDYLSLDIYITTPNTTITVRNLTGITSMNWWSSWTNIETKAGDVEYSYTYAVKGRYYILFLGCTAIGDRAFAGCSEVREITVPDGVESVGHNAFNGCSSLERICFDGATPPEIESDSFSGCTAGIYVSDDNVNAYKAAWPTYANRIHGLSEQEFENNDNNSGSSGGSSTGYSGGSDGFSLDGIFDGSDSVKILSAVALFAFVGALFMIPSFKKRKK